MKCRFCGATVTKKDRACPACGKKEQQKQIPAEYAEKKRGAIMFGCIAALAALAIALFILMHTGWDLGSIFSWAKPKANSLYCKDSYSVSNWKAKRKNEQVVATLGDMELTNGQLQIYYWMQVREFVENYGDSGAYLNMDFTEDLAEQTYTDGVTTWQQFFLKSALEVWQSNQVFAAMAEEAGYTLPSQYSYYLDNLETELDKAAADNGYSSAEEMIRKEMGAGCTVEDYMTYLRTYYTGYLYFQHLYGQIQPAEAEIDAYFTEHMADFAAAGITKGGGNYVDVRHILFVPKADTDEAWAACRREAEAVLAKWESGDMTEAEFVLLATDYSADDSTAFLGGLCADLTQGKMDAAFDQWCFESTRQPGDYDLIKTDYGYHIVYFVESEAIWHGEARLALIQAQGRDLVDKALACYPMEVDYKKIVLAEVELAG